MSSKDTGGKKQQLADELMHGKDLQVGKDVKYFLTDGDGPTREANGNINREAAAKVTYVYPEGENRGTDPNKPFGQTIFVDLVVFRRVSMGGILQLERVPFTSGREPGTCDSYQGSDVGI